MYNRFAAPDLNTEESEAENNQEEQTRYVRNTMDNIRYIINYVEKAAIELIYSELPIGTIRKKHIKITFERVGKIKGNWTANQFNHYRSHLGMVFSELEELEAIDSNYCLAMKKETSIQKLRRTLTVEGGRRSTSIYTITSTSLGGMFTPFFTLDPAQLNCCILKVWTDL